MADYSNLKNTLPAPKTLEEQYLYSLVLSAAGIAHAEPFNSPFWRMEKYWRAFYEVMSDRYTNIVPSANTVSTDTIVDGAVTADKLGYDITSRLLDAGSVSTIFIADSAVTTRKIADGAVTEDKLATDFTDKLLGSGKVTEDMLSTDVADKLLGEGKITKDMLSSEIQAILDKVK